MPSIGKVTIRQPTQTTIANPNYGVKLNIALDDLIDVDTQNIQNGYTLLFDAATQTYKPGPTGNVDILLTNITGGTF